MLWLLGLVFDAFAEHANGPRGRSCFQAYVSVCDRFLLQSIPWTLPRAWILAGGNQ